MKKLWHILFGHGKARIEQHAFRVGRNSTGILYRCRDCQNSWFKWTIRFVDDLLTDLKEGTDDFLKYSGC